MTMARLRGDSRHDKMLDLRAYVPALVATWAADPHASDHRTVTGSLVSADISGFTKLSENLAALGREGAEELTDLLNGCFTDMIDVADQYGGDVLKFGGDALLVLYTGPSHAERAALASLGMRATVDRPLATSRGARVRLRMSVGVHAGDFTFFMLEGGHKELVVSGPAATQTVVCEGEAAAGEILLSPAAAAAVPPRWLGAHHAHGRLLRRVDAVDRTDVIDLRSPNEPSDLTAFVPAAQREAIATGMPGEHRRVTTAFVKFSGTDALVARDGPGPLAEQLQELAAAVATATERYEVHWLGSDIYPDGGKVILAAGAPTSSGDDDERMVRAVHDVLQRSSLRLRAGVNGGPVFAGIVGAPQRRTFTVMGDAVNLAARLMQKADEGQLVASRAVLDRVQARVQERALEPFLVKGKSQPIHAAVVEGVRDPTDFDAEDDALPFVGREAELARIDDAFAAARSGRGRVLEIVAGPGVGKTRLLDAVRQHHDDFVYLAVRCGQYAQGTPYFAARSLLRQLAGIPHDADALSAGVLLESWVATVAPDLLPWLPLLAIPADATVAPTPEASSIDESFKRQRIHQTVARVLGNVMERPYLLAVEDAHWIDDASETLIRDLLALAGVAPVVVWVGRRPTDGEAWATPDTGARIDLEPLGTDATAALIAAAGDDLPDGAVDLLIERSGGNPLFVRELLSTVRRAGDLEALPESLESLVTARIDTLPAADRMLLREAAVLGVIVDLDVLAGATGTELSPARWRRLDEFVEPGRGQQVRFRHALHRQVAYEGLSYRQRRHMHRAVGLEIERRGGDAAKENAALLSLHFSHGRDHARAWEYACIGADAARAKFATVEAGELYQRALDSGRGAGVGDPELRRVQEALGDVRELSARYAEASTAYGAARRLAEDVGTKARLLRKEGELRERAGRYSDALRWYGRALGTLADVDPDEPAAASIVGLWLAYAGVRFRQGRYEECIRWAGEAAAEAERRDSRSELAHAYYLLDLGHYSLGSGDETYRGKALPLYEEAGDLIGEANVLNNLGMVAQYDGRFEDGIELYERSRAASERAGDLVGAATASNNIGECLLGLDREADAIEPFERAWRIWRSAPYPVGIYLALSNLGHANARLGNLDLAERMLEEARAGFDDIKVVGFGLQAALRLADCAARRGDLDRARDQLEAVRQAAVDAGARLFSGEREELEASIDGLAARLTTGAA